MRDRREIIPKPPSQSLMTSFKNALGKKKTQAFAQRLSLKNAFLARLPQTVASQSFKMGISYETSSNNESAAVTCADATDAARLLYTCTFTTVQLLLQVLLPLVVPVLLLLGILSPCNCDYYHCYPATVTYAMATVTCATALTMQR